MLVSSGRAQADAEGARPRYLRHVRAYGADASYSCRPISSPGGVGDVAGASDAINGVGFDYHGAAAAIEVGRLQLDLGDG